MVRSSLVGAVVWLGVCAAATHAQGPSDPKASPLEAATARKTDAPVTAELRPAAPPDPEFARISANLIGSFGGAQGGADLRLHIVPISVEELDSALYFEIARADSPATPFRQGVFHLYRFKGEPRLRVFDISGAAPLIGEGGVTSKADSMAGLWAAPDALPKLTLAWLSPNADLVLTPEGSPGAYSGRTAHPFASTRDGAVEMTSRITIAPGALTLSDSGFAADGSIVWGGDAPATFQRLTAPAAAVSRTSEGLIIITLVAPPADSPRLVENGTATVQYTGWMTDGTRFDTSRRPNRKPFGTRIPGSLIRGWNEGLAGIAKGERRRLVVPSALAYGERGSRAIPPNSTLIFDIECLHIDNTVPPELSQPGANPAPMVNPHSFQPPARPAPTSAPK